MRRAVVALSLSADLVLCAVWLGRPFFYALAALGVGAALLFAWGRASPSC